MLARICWACHARFKDLQMRPLNGVTAVTLAQAHTPTGPVPARLHTPGAVYLTGDQVTLALQTAGVDAVEDPQLIATTLNTVLRQSAPSFALMPYWFEPSHYRIVLERQQP
jgi:hypothetical protein